MYKKFVVNLIFPAIGLLRVWNVVVEREWRYVGLWGILPWVVILWYDWRQQPGFAFANGIAIFSIIGIYVLGWIISSMRDAGLVFSKDHKADNTGTSLLLMLSVAMPLWLPVWYTSTQIPSLEATVLSPLGVVYLILLAIMMVAISLFHVVRNSKQSLGVFVFMPVVGLHGIPYLVKRRFGTATGLLLTGVAVVGLLIWVFTLDARALSSSQEILAKTVLYFAPSIYFGMWLWTIADFNDLALKPGKSEGRAMGMGGSEPTTDP